MHVWTRNSHYEVDQDKNRARWLSGIQHTESFADGWREFESMTTPRVHECLTFHWPPGAPHDMTVTSPVIQIA